MGTSREQTSKSPDRNLRATLSGLNYSTVASNAFHTWTEIFSHKASSRNQPTFVLVPQNTETWSTTTHNEVGRGYELLRNRGPHHRRFSCPRRTHIADELLILVGAGAVSLGLVRHPLCQRRDTHRLGDGDHWTPWRIGLIVSSGGQQPRPLAGCGQLQPAQGPDLMGQLVLPETTARGPHRARQLASPDTRRSPSTDQ